MKNKIIMGLSYAENLLYAACAPGNSLKKRFSGLFVHFGIELCAVRGPLVGGVSSCNAVSLVFTGAHAMEN